MHSARPAPPDSAGMRRKLTFIHKVICRVDRGSSKTSEKPLKVAKITRSGLQQNGVDVSPDGRFPQPSSGCYGTFRGAPVEGAGHFRFRGRQAEQLAEQIGRGCNRFRPQVPQKDEGLTCDPCSALQASRTAAGAGG